MADTVTNEYEPDVVSPPGETLLETLDAIEMSQSDLARRSGRPVKTINEIIKGKAAITADTALQPEKVLGIPATFWNNRERQYRESLARERERGALQEYVEWLKELPVTAMKRAGWTPDCKDKVEQVRQCLSFFGVASPEQWRQFWSQPQAAYRKSRTYQSDPGAVAAWLRKGELKAQQIECAPYDAGAFGEALHHVRALTVESPEVFQPSMVERCRLAGVAVVFVPELKGTRAFGATRWLTPRKALIQLSLRYRTDDHLWFTFFHESAHILKHGKKSVFLECGASPDHGKEEAEADGFAADLLIPLDDFEQIRYVYPYSKAEVRAFAQSIDIAPGIVVGRLQHEDLLPNTHLNGLKQRFVWA